MIKKKKKKKARMCSHTAAAAVAAAGGAAHIQLTAYASSHLYLHPARLSSETDPGEESNSAHLTHAGPRTSF